MCYNISKVSVFWFIAIPSNNKTRSIASSNMSNYVWPCEFLQYPGIVLVGSVFTFAMDWVLLTAVSAGHIIPLGDLGYTVCRETIVDSIPLQCNDI